MYKMVMMFTALLWCGFMAAAEEKMIFDSCDNPETWSFFNGGEFPGAKGGLRKDEKSGHLAMWFDFNGGGKYVAAFPKSKIPAGTNKFQIRLKSDSECMITYRIADATGRIFQGQPRVANPNIAEYEFSVSGPWSSIWGGDAGQTQPKQPLSSFTLMISEEKSKSGTLIIESCNLTCDSLPTPMFTGKDVTFDGCGWKFAAQWLVSTSGPILQITADNVNGKDLNVAFDFPAMGRNLVWRTTLSAQVKHQVFTYAPPLTDGGNANNIYQITATFADRTGNCIQQSFPLTGNKAIPAQLGGAVNSKDVPVSPFGFCAHFSYGTHGAFAGWRDYPRLLQMAADAGFKWVRDGVMIEKDDKNTFHVRNYDLEWIKLAQNHKIQTILVIDMTADEELPVFLQRVTAIAQETKGLVKVYELGNEPNNFGNWIKKHGGTWNGKEKDNSTSPWVKAHLQYTNAAADLIKKLRPDATVIGLGACAPTNIRYLDLGLTANVDGVVEHPYGFSLPPEKVPWGLNLEKRDGVRVGDGGNTFAGLVNSYIEHFKRTGKMRSLWITEFGFSTYWFNGKNESKMYLGYSEEAQAAYLVRRFVEGMTLPIAAACVYDFIDDYRSEWDMDEANFGIVRADFSPKPSYYALQHMTSLFNGYQYERNINIKVEKQPLHRACERADLVKDWDLVSIKSGTEIKAFGFVNPNRANERILAVWSTLPYSGEANNRVGTIRVGGIKEYSGKPVGIDLVTGRSFDIPLKTDGNDLILENLVLKNHPIIIKLFKP